MEIARLQIEVDARGATNSVTQLGSELTQLGNTATRTAQQVDAGMARTTRATRNAGAAADHTVSAFGRMRNAVIGTAQALMMVPRAAAAAGAAFLALGTAITATMGIFAAMAAAVAGLVATFGFFFQSIGKAAEMQTFTVQFASLLGSMKEGKKRMEELAEFAGKTPFELPEVAKASRVLEVLTKGALSTGDGLRMVGDAAYQVKVPFDDMATTVGRAFDALMSGRKAGEAMQRLQDVGILSGTVRGQIEKLQASGKKGSEVWGLLAKEFDRFKGSMANGSLTWEGQMSNLADNFGRLQTAFGTPIIEKMLPHLSDFVTMIENARPAAARMGASVAEGLEKAVVYAKQLWKQFQAFLPEIQKWVTAMKTGFDYIAGLFRSGKLGSTIESQMKQVWSTIVAWTQMQYEKAWIEIGHAAYRAFDFLQSAEFWNGVEKVAITVGHGLLDVLKELNSPMFWAGMGKAILDFLGQPTMPEFWDGMYKTITVDIPAAWKEAMEVTSTPEFWDGMAKTIKDIAGDFGKWLLESVLNIGDDLRAAVLGEGPNAKRPQPIQTDKASIDLLRNLAPLPTDQVSADDLMKDLVPLSTGTGPGPGMIPLKGTSFATDEDIARYNAALNRGVSPGDALKYGDNGVGASGRLTNDQINPMVAMSTDIMRQIFGSVKNALGNQVEVYSPHNGQTFRASVEDIGPSGVLDLNPAAARMAGAQNLDSPEFSQMFMRGAPAGTVGGIPTAAGAPATPGYVFPERQADTGYDDGERTAPKQTAEEYAKLRSLAPATMAEIQKANNDMFGAFQQGVTEMAASWGTTWDQIKKTGSSVISSISNSIGQGIADIATGSKTAQEAFAEMANSIISDIIKMIVQLTIQLAIQQALGMAFGGGGGGSIMGALQMTSGSVPVATAVNHSGGLVGDGSPSRHVGAQAFLGAPRYHSGLASSEQAAILQRGEMVLTAAQARDVSDRLQTRKENATGPAAKQEVKIMNFVDPRQVADAISQDPDIVVNAISRRASVVRKVLNQQTTGR